MTEKRNKSGTDRRMYRGTRRKKRNFWLLFSTLFALWMMYLFVGGDYGLLKVISLKSQETHLRKELLRLRARREVLLSENRRLRTDMATVEKIAREELGMIREGETRYQFPENYEPKKK